MCLGGGREPQSSIKEDTKQGRTQDIRVSTKSNDQQGQTCKAKKAFRYVPGSVIRRALLVVIPWTKVYLQTKLLAFRTKFRVFSLFVPGMLLSPYSASHGRLSVVLTTLLKMFLYSCCILDIQMFSFLSN